MFNEFTRGVTLPAQVIAGISPTDVTDVYCGVSRQVLNRYDPNLAIDPDRLNPSS